MVYLFTAIIGICLLFAVFSFLKKEFKKSAFLTFTLILAIGAISSTFPFGFVGLVMGAPAVIINTILISLVFKNELFYYEKT